MAITPLPQATIHLLGSAQALTTPTSLVKELIDNALDAKASYIDILISPNTIDKIEVRDNGHGIQQEDLDALGRRGHTSKLRSFDELKSIGGVSLGFRGEALASAVQLGEVTVTTRTEGESVATTVKLKAPGGIDSRSRTSHPIGTTIVVTKFVYKLPVRKQTFLKEASKTLGKIKELLQAYVLARPNIKFSFKVLKEKKGLWSYAPHPCGGVKEAVSQIFGKETASQCISKSTRFPERAHDADISTEHEEDLTAIESSLAPDSNDFIIDVFLPKPDADPSKIGHGQFISVDLRPVSHEKSTTRRIVTIFKRYMKESLSESLEKTKSPFLRLNITCPVGSYDPNVEPGKNDVIFGNESIVLEAIESLFREVYGEPKAVSSLPPSRSPKGKLDNFELLLARNPAIPAANNSLSPAAKDLIPVQPHGTSISKVSTGPLANDLDVTEGSSALDNQKIYEPVDGEKRKWAFDMSRDFTEEVEGYEKPSRRFQQSQSIQMSASDVQPDPRNSLNPWIIAKMTAPIQQRDQRASTTTRASHPISRPVADPLPTPQHSSDPVASERDIHFQGGPSGPRQTFRNDDIRSLDISPVRNLPCQRPEPGYIQRQGSGPNRRPLTADFDDEVLLDGDDSEVVRPRNDFVSARNVPDAALLSPPACLGPKRPRGVNRPFVPPMRRNTENISSNEVDSLRQTKLTNDYGASRGHNGISQDVTEQQPNPDLVWSMDFERRKELASRRRGDELRAAALEVDSSGNHEVVRTSPHKNRYNAAIATLGARNPPLSTIGTLKEPFKTSLPDGDPRAYLMRRQISVMAQRAKSGEVPKMTRAKSNRLPLETVAENDKMHNLVLRPRADMDRLQKVMKQLMKSDMYVKKGNAICGLRIDGLETTGVASRVQAIVSKWMESQGKENCEVEYTFDNLVAVE
jgi:DNA mismatch repair protein MutL